MTGTLAETGMGELAREGRRSSLVTSRQDRGVASGSAAAEAAIHWGNDAVQASDRLCAHLTREHARNFYHGLKLAPSGKRRHLFAVYAWMRGADDCVDEANGPDDARAALDAFEATTWRVLGVGDSDRAASDDAGIWPAFRRTVLEVGVDHGVLRGMIRGQASDIGRSAIETETELNRYCADVAGTVGLACLSVWGVRRGRSADQARSLALLRGQAFQRTNILRDLVEDLRAESPRCYLPIERLRRYGLAPETVLDPARRARALALVRDSAAEAEAFYARTGAFEQLICPECAPVSRTMTRIYRGVLTRIARDPASVLDGRRVGLGRRHKIALGLLGLAERWTGLGR